MTNNYDYKPKTNSIGSVYDDMYITDEEDKKKLGATRKAMDEGKIDVNSAHSIFQQTREKYGYSGGTNGSEYIPLNTYKPGKTPTLSGKYSDYAKQIEDSTRKYINREKFTYDPEQDETYKYYKDAYTRGGQQAMEAAMAQTSARTGGLASSYAGTTAQQSYDSYMKGLADKIPELRQLAYQMYRDEDNRSFENINLLNSLRSNTLQDYNVALNAYNIEENQNRQAYLDRMDRMKNEAALRAQTGDYSGYRELYGLGNKSIEALNSYAAEDRNYQTRQRAMERAKLMEQYGDYSGLRDLGINVNSYEDYQNWQRNLERAMVKAQYEDYSGLRALGINVNGYEDYQNWQRNLERAMVRAQYEDYGGLRDLGIDVNSYEAYQNWQRALEKARIKAQYGDMSGLQEMGLELPIDYSSFESMGISNPNNYQINKLIKLKYIEEYTDGGKRKYRLTNLGKRKKEENPEGWYLV